MSDSQLGNVTLVSLVSEDSFWRLDLTIFLVAIAVAPVSQWVSESVTQSVGQ